MIKSVELGDQFCHKASAQLFNFLTIAVWPYYERIYFFIRVDGTSRVTTTNTIDLKSERFYNFKNIGFRGAYSKSSTLFMVFADKIGQQLSNYTITVCHYTGNLSNNGVQ